jgi:hypothetical protein
MGETHSNPPDDSSPPREVVVSTATPELHYELAEELVADPNGSDPVASIRPASEGADPSDSESWGPVYRRVPSGELVVPTGRVLVGFPPGDVVESHAEELRTARYVVEQVLPYATNTAWVRSATGGVTDALIHLGLLSELPSIVTVEPQMLGQSARRG